jgi:DNA-binding NarL/FixJ family response regulator
MTIRILIADDHGMMRDGLTALLAASTQVEVVAAVSNGREAVRLAQKLMPDVVIMDISMPDLNGIEAARIMRERCPLTQIVILSMHSSSEHVFRAFDAGASAYILKESAAVEVNEALHAVRAGRRYLSPGLASLDFASRLEGVVSPLDSLSARERYVLQLVVEGHSSRDIARRIHLSPKTVETYRSRLMRKLGVKDVPGLVRFAIEHGLTPASPR